MKHLSDKIFFGIVEDNKDPNRKGRIKVRVQSVFDDIPVEDIPYAAPAYSVDGKSFNIPAVGKVVSVIFGWGDLYQPYYAACNYFNVNLQSKLNAMSDEEYVGFTALSFDNRCQIYIDDTDLTLDYLFNKITINENQINHELKDNKGVLNLGSEDADQQVLLSNHFFDWFDEFIKELVKPSSLISGAGPVTKLKLDEILAKYNIVKSSFLSKNVFVVDNDKVKKLS
jgi:hypothetical protein